MKAALLILITVLAASTAAHAQAPDAATNAAADAALQEGRRLYDLREWDAAIAKLKEAYRLRPDAPSLYNIAQATRLKGDCAQALNFYRTYKRNFPSEKNIDQVDKFIEEMDACVKQGPAKSDPTQTRPPKKIEPTKTEPWKPAPKEISPIGPTPPVQTSKNPGRGKRVAGLVIGGAGVIGLGAGTFFALRANRAANDAESAMTGEMWDPSIESSGRSAARNAKISFAVGGALVVTGAILFVLGRDSSSETAHVTVIPQHEGATLVWGGAF
jgi:tetratricopeptide (TPR) repeat protein